MERLAEHRRVDFRPAAAKKKGTRAPTLTSSLADFVPSSTSTSTVPYFYHLSTSISKFISPNCWNSSPYELFAEMEIYGMTGERLGTIGSTEKKPDEANLPQWQRDFLSKPSISVRRGIARVGALQKYSPSCPPPVAIVIVYSLLKSLGSLRNPYEF